jgi:hypothetical protein
MPSLDCYRLSETLQIALTAILDRAMIAPHKWDGANAMKNAYLEPATMTDSLGRFFVLHNGAFVEPTEHDGCFARMPDGCVYALCFDGQWH